MKSSNFLIDSPNEFIDVVVAVIMIWIHELFSNDVHLASFTFQDLILLHEIFECLSQFQVDYMFFILCNYQDVFFDGQWIWYSHLIPDNIVNLLKIFKSD